LPVIVASALSGTSGKICSSTSPWPAVVPEWAAELLGASASVFASVRREAGEGEAAGGGEAAFAGGFAGAVFGEFLLAAGGPRFALRETPGFSACASGPGPTAAAA